MGIDDNSPRVMPSYSEITKYSTKEYDNKSRNKEYKNKMYWRKKDILADASLGLLPTPLTFWFVEAGVTTDWKLARKC